jgi:hypothetical protein
MGERMIDRENEFTKLRELFEYMAKQFVMLVESNNNLLVENLRLMKENKELRK